MAIKDKTESDNMLLHMHLCFDSVHGHRSHVHWIVLQLHSI